jgi:glutamate formiminotransferase / formiminotetrahydrofolate cyclodeaminase
MDRILECVPNVSEGRDNEIIAKLASSITNINGVKLLHADFGESAKRTVFTFAGEPGRVIDAAYNLIKTASNLVDMRKHSGSIHRLGL